MADDTSPIVSFRTQLTNVMPWWLRGWLGGRLLYAIGIHIDLLADMAADAVGLRFPRSAQPDALSPLGQDRRIPRGRAEPASTYIVRLRRWLDDHRTRGGPYAMLAQLHAFWAVTPFAITLIYALGKSFGMTTDGTITEGTVTAGGPWARWWLLFAWPNGVLNDSAWNSGGTWSDGGVWDSNLSGDDVADIRCVPTAWNAAHCRGRVVVMSPGGTELWDFPAGLWSDAGVWGTGEDIAFIDIEQ